MGRPPRTKVEFEGLDKLITLSGPKLYAEPWKRVLQESGEVVLKAAQSRAPGNGRIGGTLTVRMEGGVLPTRAIVPLKLREGIILQYGGRRKLSRYRVGMRRGKKVRGWFSGAVRLKAVKNAVQQVIEQAKREIEGNWKKI